MSNVAIRVEGLSKQYHIGGPQKQFDTLGAQVLDMARTPLRRVGNLLSGRAKSAADMSETFWALQDVSFEIKKGEVVGVIGRNGAGKSTLLKILSRITDPTHGQATIYGRVGSLLEVGTGFHPELTGRENVFLNGGILGMRRHEIQRKFDEIVAFAEIDKFIDTPVKHYSSGMYVRLAFSVAAHLEPEVLLVDEVLAVGDIAFQRKSLGKMNDVAQEGRTVLFVSHNMALMQKLCQRGVLLGNGRLVVDGLIDAAVDGYMRSLEKVQTIDLALRTDRTGRGAIKLIGVEVRDGSGDNTQVLRTGQPARLLFHVQGITSDTSCVFDILNFLGQRIAVFKSDNLAPADSHDPQLGATFVCDISALMLMPGRYYLNVLLRGRGEWQDFVESVIAFDVEAGLLDGRAITAETNREISFTMPHRWTVPF